MPGDRRFGFAITEVLVAMALLALASAGLSGLLVQSGDALHRSSRAERDMIAATEAMTRVSLWPRERLWAEAGSTRVAGLTVHIMASSPSLFEVAVLGQGERPLLSTTLLRPDYAR